VGVMRVAKKGNGEMSNSSKFRHGENAEDISKYLIEFTEHRANETKIVKCKKCTADSFTFEFDEAEGAIEVTCDKCGEKWLLLDSDEFWEDCEDIAQAQCPECECENFNVGVAFERRDDGDVKWVYVGARCTGCGLIGLFVDWKIDYSPTDDLVLNA
jgi:RNase P subunit RPR2